MRPISRLPVILLLAALAVSCAAPLVSTGGRAGQLLQSDKPREQTQQAPEADLAELAAGNTAFAADLYRQLISAEDGNLFYSPYSISLALAMTYAGARGETQQQMAAALNFTLPPERLHPAFNAIAQQIASRAAEGGQGSDGEGFQLHVVNDLWGQQDYAFLPEYLDVISQYYGAGVRLVDFINNPGGSRQQINDYIAEKTEQRIQDLLPANSVTPDTRLILTNAIYFDAAWAYPFDAGSTRRDAFTLLDGTSVDVDMMTLPMASSLRYTAGDGYEAVELPYDNRSISMLLIVPDAGQFSDFEARLDAERLAGIVGALDTQKVHVVMPKFTFESAFSLADPLSALGMAPAFTSDADFSGINGRRDLYISDVMHKAFVKVDEAGTEAAAATAVVMKAAGMPMDEPVLLRVDRPFIFLIRDEPTNTILFLGRMLDPR